MSERVERVLLVEDDAGLRRLLAEELEDAGIDVYAVGSAEEALAQLSRTEPDLVISDIRLPGADGMELLERVRGIHAPPSFLVITAFGSIAQAVAALKAGADEFLTKPLDLEHFLLCVRRILDTRKLRGEVRRFRELLDDSSFHGMVGQSRPMRVLFDQIRQLAKASGPVLIIGESGTGKELVAKAVHEESDRAAGPFMAVNCAGIPAELLESEFFGHETGAFTGAAKARKGLFRQADGGSLFLDEIGEMPLALQAKLLRVLQEGSIRPVGSEKEVPVDVRIIAATNRDLDALRGDSDFREDLFFRLETFTLNVPPLREREDDLELLAARFLERFSAQMERRIQSFSSAALERLRAYGFPGNVRELQNAVERAVTFCHGGTIGVEHLPNRIQGSPEQLQASSSSLMEGLIDGPMLPTLEELEQRYIRHVLELVDGNKRRAAALLGIGRRTLYRRLGSEVED
ncbi:sigma-54-dependent Fis family transcriptional regulator [Alkalilimnicola ehrlichii]|uniref:Sigma-54-dependent Fis family transcriptional regulator n=1 Tax=Alkalilimnicola ehrlichii TaxID=351052 RepID=A0A3E0WTX7_9GAMM|nr:sigma-54 dependent transcriptional regulator [Alkalilimnicola ehrlichii]RFA29841.1 sigma-54-dependent Fis family transcriptional regulator [Alkalilimnicola ehrlichii]RFA36430.1 sigma-54-dependent Fis family transcriptional regulator [Alkalilimnicola ehrlichii]